MNFSLHDSGQSGSGGHSDPVMMASSTLVGIGTPICVQRSNVVSVRRKTASVHCWIWTELDPELCKTLRRFDEGFFALHAGRGPQIVCRDRQTHAEPAHRCRQARTLIGGNKNTDVTPRDLVIRYARRNGIEDGLGSVPFSPLLFPSLSAWFLISCNRPRVA
jgi:hypothetical protein